MKRTKIFIVLISLMTTLAHAQLPDPFSIAAFNITQDTIHETANFIISAQTIITGSDTLGSIASPPPFIRPGQVVKRKKYGADYRLFTGNLATSAFRATPPVYAFTLPAWSRAGQAMWYRFYTQPTNNRNLDIETVYFDNERIYVQHHQTIYYSRNDVWDSIVGVNAAPYGDLHIESDPPGAEIYFYGTSTGRKTPATFSGLVAGRYEVELFLPEYRFQRRAINVRAGAAAHASFQLASGFDTLHVIGEHQYGNLVLPHPPLDSAYIVGDSSVSASQIRLIGGYHRVLWRGGGVYKDIDTIVEVPAGRVVYFNVPFERLGGFAFFELTPEDALVCIEGFQCQEGEFELRLPSGFHTVRISRHGFEPQRRQFVVSHAKRSRVLVVLDENADRDYDGFPDSLDRCPDEYGLFDGCPELTYWRRVALRFMELSDYMETEPFSATVSVMGYVGRTPVDNQFNNILSSYSGGLGGGFNNQSGLTIGNMYQVSFRGFMASAELGQWSSGIKYRRPEPLDITTSRGDTYRIFADTLRGIDPAIFIPSTAFSVGFKYRLLNYSLGYSLGYQFEDIVLTDVCRLTYDGRCQEFLEVRFDNDYWFHEIMLEADIFMDLAATPSIYAKFKFPFGPVGRTHWHSFNVGLQVRFRPINLKK